MRDSASCTNCWSFDKTGNKNVQLVLNNLNELNRFCAFYHPLSNLPCNKSGCWRLRVVAESKEQFFFLRQSLYILRALRYGKTATFNLSCNKSSCCRLPKCFLYMLRVLSARGKLVRSKWSNSLVLRDYRVILSNQKSAFTQLATTLFAGRQVSFIGGKTRKIAIQLFCSNVAKQIARFCHPFNRSFRHDAYWRPNMMSSKFQLKNYWSS